MNYYINRILITHHSAINFAGIVESGRLVARDECSGEVAKWELTLEYLPEWMTEKELVVGAACTNRRLSQTHDSAIS